MNIPYIAPVEEHCFKTKYDLVPLLQPFLKDYCQAITPDTDIQDLLCLALLERAFLIVSRDIPKTIHPFDWVFFHDLFDVTEEGIHQASHIFHTEPTPLYYEDLIVIHNTLPKVPKSVIGCTYGFYDGNETDPISVMTTHNLSVDAMIMSYTEFFHTLLSLQKRKKSRRS
jgi:hypothetical protein